MRRAPWTIALATALVTPTLLAARRRGQGPARGPRQRRPPLRHPHPHRLRTDDGLIDSNRSLAGLIPGGQTEWTNSGHDFGYWRPALKGQLDWMLAKFPTS